MRHPEVVQGSEGWHALRLDHLGSSEVAALFGVQADYAASHFTLHQVKARKIPPPEVESGPGSRVWMGRMMEPVISQMAQELYRWPGLEYPGPWCTDDTTAQMSASLDGIILEPGPEEEALGYSGPGLLEIKRSEWLAHSRAWTQGEPPYQVILQAQHGCACSGLKWGCVVVLVGEKGLVAYRYRAREQTIRLIRQAVAKFWEGVRKGEPPNPDHTASSAEALKALFPERQRGESLSLLSDDDADVMCASFLLASENRKESDRVYNRERNQLLWKMKDATSAETVNHWIDLTVTSNDQVRIKVTEKVRT